MNKKSLLILALLLIFPISAFATENPKVLTLETNVDGNIIGYNGTTENGSYAVMCKLYNSSNEEINMYSLAVDNQEFEGTFIVSAAGTYKVRCANYEGGEIKEVSALVGEQQQVYYAVTFNSNGGSEVESEEVASDDLATEPNPPTKEDMIFDGWYEDATLTTRFDFNTPIINNVTLYAKWVEENNNEEDIKVEFDTRAEIGKGPIYIKKGDKVAKPEDPTNGDMVFAGWFLDDTYQNEFDFNTPITDNITLYAKWVEENNSETENYAITDSNGNTISFTQEKDREFTLYMSDFLTLTDEELDEYEISKEIYNQYLEILIDATKDSGTLLAFYNIEVYNDDNFPIHEGKFDIKIKMTDEMKNYNTFKIIYVDLDNDFATESPIPLTIDGEYLVGTLNHLSAYAITGSNTSTVNTPQTGDNIYIWFRLLIISILGLLLGMFTAIKIKKSKVR